MSKQIISEKMEAKCDGCGGVKVWEVVGADQNSDIVAEMQEWYTVGRKIATPDGRLIGISADACSLACVPAAAVKLALPPQIEEPADNIDLASLRASNLQAN